MPSQIILKACRLENWKIEEFDEDEDEMIHGEFQRDNILGKATIFSFL